MKKEELRNLFELRDRLATELRMVDQTIAEKGRAYWQSKGFVGMPRVESLRNEVKQP